MLTIITTDGATMTEDDEVRLKIIQNICTSNDNVFFKSQQIDDPELSLEEKQSIVMEMFQKKDSLFLSRFGNFINSENLVYFERSQEDEEEEYIVRQHLEQIRQWQKNREIVIRNRRYAAMQKMIEESTYFTEREMMNRSPLMYDQLIGRFLTEEEKKSRDTRDHSSLVNVLLNGIEDSDYRERLNEQRNQDENQDQGSSNSSDNSAPTREQRSHWGEFTEGPEASTSTRPRREFVTKPEREILRQEFIGMMYTNFLQGADKEFDYSTVDNNSDYDNDVIRSQDEEEKYFDADDDTSESHPGMQLHLSESSEDELDVYMRHLRKHPTVQEQL
ncbi:coiled-coil domain-containing protein 97 [Sergentomyia squamirostris]